MGTKTPCGLGKSKGKGRLETPIGRPNLESIEDSESEVPGRFEIGAANRQPRPLHRGRRYPRRTPATSVEGSGSLIGGPNPKSTGDLRFEVLSRSRLGPPIGDFNPSTLVADVLRGYRRP
ncbi:hypothetical protein CRG98_041844 [Punica granatum]|uniref:Uncharacterized protein n=1 Tax=Punica granatum TaxID=22663 RepID=A0A2I0I1S2_PUNGR|nr:hypothetical protein CRG98_041844 [Punica granatum]